MILEKDCGAEISTLDAASILKGAKVDWIEDSDYERAIDISGMDRSEIAAVIVNTKIILVTDFKGSSVTLLFYEKSAEKITDKLCTGPCMSVWITLGELVKVSKIDAILTKYNLLEVE